MSNTYDKITRTLEHVQNVTGIDLTPATQELRDAEQVRALLLARRVAAVDVNRAAIEAVNAHPDEFDTLYENARAVALDRLIADTLTYGEPLRSLTRRVDNAREAAAQTAVTLLTPHVTKLGKELANLATVDLTDPDTAIRAGHTKEYTRAIEIITELEAVAALSAGKHHPAVTVTQIPTVPPYTIRETWVSGLRTDSTPDHTPDELELIEQIREFVNADTFAAKVLTAARHRWGFTPTLDPHKRNKNLDNATATNIVRDGFTMNVGPRVI